MTTKRQATPLGRLIRNWRRQAGIAQRDLAAKLGTSVRHLSFIENGRAHPKKDMVLAIAGALDMKDPSIFLEAAGYLAPYASIDWSSPEGRQLRRDLEEVIDAQPYPAFCNSRQGTLLHYNAIFSRGLQLFIELPNDADTGNGYEILLRLQPYMVGFDQLVSLYRDRLFRELVRGAERGGGEQIEHVRSRIGGHSYEDDGIPHVFVPFELRGNGHSFRLKLLTMTFGPPQDVALRNFRMTTLLPADAETEAALEPLRHP